jgi:hypothetical protein
MVVKAATVFKEAGPRSIYYLYFEIGEVEKEELMGPPGQVPAEYDPKSPPVAEETEWCEQSCEA